MAPTKTSKGSKRGARVDRAPSGRVRRPVHFHIENTGDLGPVFQVTRKRLSDALAQHPKVARQLKITLGTDGDIFDQAIKTADVLFAWKFPHRGISERAPDLKWIHAHGAGINHFMPLDWLPKGAVLTNSRGVHGDRASEYAMMAILALNNRLPEMVANQRAARWEQLYNTGIAGKTLLIIGVGSVGGGTARMAKKFGLRVVGVRRSGEAHPAVDEMHQPSSLRRLLPKADFVLVTAPHTDDTHHLLGKKEITLMKRGAGLVNYSRANLVNYGALRNRLQRGELSAVLDVFDPEPLPSSSPLWRTRNLIITPHSSSDDAERYTPDTLDLVFRNMARFLKGQPLLNRVRPNLGY
jgi:phosphoglycerate dehydrogenase-like enzyme